MALDDIPALPVAAAGLVGLAFVLSVLLCALMRLVAPRIGLVDAPGGRKAHGAPMPLGGGVAIWLAILLVLGIGALVALNGANRLPPVIAQHVSGMWERSGELAWIMGIGTAMMLFGLVDDRLGLGWWLKLVVQVGLAVAVVATGVQVTLFFPFAGRWVMGALTVLWIVGLTNAFNFLDNMDGLSASVGVIAALLFAGAQVSVGSLFVPAVLLVVAGALAGFLVHNRFPARLFMGDAGSTSIGFLLGCLTVAGTFYRPGAGFSPFSVFTPLLVMAVPLYDAVSVVWIRLREGRSPFVGDRRHFSHRLVERGLTPALAVWTIDLVTLAAGLGALLLHKATALQACAIVLQTACLLGVVGVLEFSKPRSE